MQPIAPEKVLAYEMPNYQEKKSIVSHALFTHYLGNSLIRKYSLYNFMKIGPISSIPYVFNMRIWKL